jgi:hypothetical protein
VDVRLTETERLGLEDTVTLREIVLVFETLAETVVVFEAVPERLEEELSV